MDFLSVAVSLLIPALRGLSQNKQSLDFFFLR